MQLYTLGQTGFDEGPFLVGFEPLLICYFTEVQYVLT